jgi:hypothetical protein
MYNVRSQHTLLNVQKERVFARIGVPGHSDRAPIAKKNSLEDRTLLWLYPFLSSALAVSHLLLLMKLILELVFLLYLTLSLTYSCFLV